MNCPFRSRRLFLAILGVFLFPPLLWCGLVTVVPTECARLKIEASLSAATGRAVAVGRVKVGVLGGVSVRDLKIGSSGSTENPWLQVGEASIDVGFLALFRGRVEPSTVTAEGIHLRLLRHADGSLELADLFAPAKGGTPERRETAESEDAGSSEAGLEIVARNATVVVVDEPTGTTLEFTKIAARGTYEGGRARIVELRGDLNGGSVELAAQVECDGSQPRYEGQLRFRDVALDSHMKALAYLAPVCAGMDDELEGKLALDLYLQGEGADRESVRKSLVGSGRMALDPVLLDGSKLLAQLGRLTEAAPVSRVGSVRTGLAIRRGRVISDDLTLDVFTAPLVLVGWTDFDGRLDYRLQTEAATDKLPARAREFLLERNVDIDDLTDVRVQGTVSSLVVTCDGVPIGTPTTDPRSSDDRLREIGKRLRDRIRR
jgi:uncharacterized protein involved in outer membrane biogenesis